MTNPNGNPFSGGGDKTPALSWKDVPVGTTYECVVTDWPTTAQAKDYDSGLPQFWDPVRKGVKTATPNDQPVKNAIVPVTIGGQPWAIFATLFGSSLFYAIQDAQNNAGAEVAPGGVLTITLTDREVDPEKPHRKPRNKFSATYRPPNAFAGEAPPAAAAPAQPAATPAPAAPPAQPAPAPQSAPPAQPAPAAQNTVTAAQFAALQAAGVDVSAFTIAG